MNAKKTEQPVPPSGQDLIKTITEAHRQFENSLPPVERWNPDLSGDIDIRIDREGRWFHEGDEIKRHQLVKLFASILKKENDDFFLVTPVEKWRIKVDEEPFVFTGIEVIDRDGQQSVALTTNTDQQVVIGEENPFWLEHQGKEPRPKALVYRDLVGLLNRNVFYELVEIAQVDSETGQYYFNSQGVRFDLPVEE